MILETARPQISNFKAGEADFGPYIFSALQKTSTVINNIFKTKVLKFEN